MLKRFVGLADVGIVSDADPRLLPDNVWSDGQNVRFNEGRVEKSKGQSSVFTTPSVDPYWLLPVRTESVYYWMYPSLTKCYVTDGTTNTNITRQTTGVDVDYSADADIGWNGAVIGNVPVINNGVDDPQMWSPVGTGTKLQSLTWASGQTWSSQSKSARVIRSFKKFLVALDVTESATRYRQRVRWSHPADSGAVPSTWDETDTTKDAGYYDLDEGGGSLIDCLPLRDTNVIYKEDKTIGMQYIGGQYIFRFYNIFEEVGILTRRCVKPFLNKHFVVTQGDVIVHDGNAIDPVINHKKRKELFGLIDATNYQRTYVVPNYQKHELWVCFPETGASFATLAMIWNYRDNTWTVRELPTAKHIGFGLVNPGGTDDWDTDFGSWDQDFDLWGELEYSPAVIKNLMAGSTEFFLADDTEQFDGVSMESYVTKESMDLGDPNMVKLVKAIWPRIECSGDITISIGTQMNKSDPIAWTDMTYSSGSDKVDCLVSGRFISIRFYSNTDVTWNLTEFEIEYDNVSRY